MTIHRLTLLALALALGLGTAAGAPADAPPKSAATAVKQVVKARKTVARKGRVKKRKARRQRWPVRRPEAALKQMPALGNVPFPEGERLAFRIQMLGAVAGEAVLAVGKRTQVDGRPVVPLVAWLRSSEFLSKFYPIENKLVVIADERTFRPLETDFAIRENGAAIDYHTLFDEARRWVKSTRVKDGKTLKRDFTTSTGVYEALSSVYGARRLDLKEGQVFEYYVWDGRKERLVEVTAGGIEKVWTPAGWYEAQKLSIATRVTGGFIKRQMLDDPPMRGFAWIGRDPNRTPVKLVTPTKLGDAEAVLVRRYVEKV